MFQIAFCRRWLTDFSDSPIPVRIDDTSNQSTILLLCQCVSPRNNQSSSVIGDSSSRTDRKAQTEMDIKAISTLGVRKMESFSVPRNDG